MKAEDQKVTKGKEGSKQHLLVPSVNLQITLRGRASSPEEKEDAERGSKLVGDHCWHGSLTNARRSSLRGDRRWLGTAVRRGPSLPG